MARVSVVLSRAALVDFGVGIDLGAGTPVTGVIVAAAMFNFLEARRLAFLGAGAVEGDFALALGGDFLRESRRPSTRARWAWRCVRDSDRAASVSLRAGD